MALLNLYPDHPILVAIATEVKEKCMNADIENQSLSAAERDGMTSVIEGSENVVVGAPLPKDPVVAVSPEDRIAQLEAELDAVRAKHAADMQLTGDKLGEMANARAWCSEYDTIVKQLNDGLHVPLPMRVEQWMFWWTIPIIVPARDANDQRVNEFTAKAQTVERIKEILGNPDAVEGTDFIYYDTRYPTWVR